jgi:hypothetical protein
MGVFVVDDYGEHVVPRYDPTHRSLQTSGDAAADLAGRLRIEDVTLHSFTREQLRLHLRTLLERGCLRERFLPIARQLLDACASK